MWQWHIVMRRRLCLIEYYALVPNARRRIVKRATMKVEVAMTKRTSLILQLIFRFLIFVHDSKLDTVNCTRILLDTILSL